jgi:hypothetical protein
MTPRSGASKMLRLGAAGILVALGLLSWPAAAAAQSITVDSSAEAWYREAPTPAGDEGPEAPDPCGTLGSCPAPVPAAPTEPPTGAAYPLGTLHVEATAGESTAHAYITPDLTYLPVGTTLLSGSLTLPVSQRENAGSYQVGDAKIVACLTTEPVTDDVYGGTGKAPAFDCEQATAKATYDKKARSFGVDLGAFLDAWSAGAPNYGVALVPDPDLGPQAAWHATLNGDETEQGKPASAEIFYRTTPLEAPVETPDSLQAPAAPLTGGTTSGSAGIGAPVPAQTSPQAGAAPQVAPASAAQQAPYSLVTSPWYTYRGVVFLPLAFLVALSLTGRSLTRPLSGSPG